MIAPQIDGGEDRRRNRDRVRCKGEDELDRKIRASHRSRSSRADLRIDDNRLASHFQKRELRRWRRKVVGASEQLHQLTPADRTVVRIGCRLRQHRIQAIVETHRDIRFLQDRSIPDLVVRAPTEGGDA